MIGIEFHVTGNEQVEKPIVIVITPCGSSGPAAKRNASLFGNVSERPVVIVVIQPIFAEVRDINIRPAVVVKVSNGNPESPALIRYICLFSDIGESSVMVVMQKHRFRSWFFAIQRREG